MIAADLFAGLGGLTEGAEQTQRARVALAVNHNADAVRWHEVNHPHTVHACQDLAEFDWTRVPSIDLLLAAPACQGHSSAGKPAAKGRGGSHAPDPDKLRAKHQRDRNTAWAVLAAADTLRPRTIVIENVPRFLRWRTFDAWRGVLDSMGYHTTVQTPCALDYGVGQDRTRAIIIADLRRPIHLEPTHDARPTIADALLDDDDPTNRWAPIASKSDRVRALVAKAQREAGARCFWNNVSESRGRPLDDVFPTATTQSGTQFNLVDGDRIRVLGPREMARVQGFPDTYQIPRDRKTASRLIGNATPVPLARAIVEQVA